MVVEMVVVVAAVAAAAAVEAAAVCVTVHVTERGVCLCGCCRLLHSAC